MPHIRMTCDSNRVHTNISTNDSRYEIPIHNEYHLNVYTKWSTFLRQKAMKYRSPAMHSIDRCPIYTIATIYQLERFFCVCLLLLVRLGFSVSECAKLIADKNPCFIYFVVWVHLLPLISHHVYYACVNCDAFTQFTTSTSRIYRTIRLASILVTTNKLLPIYGVIV